MVPNDDGLWIMPEWVAWLGWAALVVVAILPIFVGAVLARYRAWIGLGIFIGVMLFIYGTLALFVLFYGDPV